MNITQSLLDSLTAQAKASPRLRMNYDLRDSAQDGSQRMLNALEPGTVLPIHRHRTTSETVVILRGWATQEFYDDQGRLTESVTMAPGSDCVGMSIAKGSWHKLISHESGTVILECKDGPYEPLGEEDVLTALSEEKV